MDEKVKTHLTKIATDNGWPTTEESLVEILTEGHTVWSGNEDERRWWTDYDHVVEIDGMFIMFRDAKTTGDDSPWDKGWEFDPSTIKEVKPITKTIEVTEYVPVS